MAKEYSYYQTDCSQGYPIYHGIVADSDGNVLENDILSQSDMLAAGQAIGCNPHASGNFGRKPPARGAGLLQKTQAIGVLMKAPQSVIDQVKRLAPLRWPMLMELSNKNVPIANPNNLFEIATKYAEIHPALPTPAGKMKSFAMQPKSAGTGFDFGSAFGFLGNLVNTIVDGVNSGGVNAFLTNWANQFNTYMTADFKSIQDTLNATAAAPGPWGGYGPKGALDMLLRFKSTSWADLKKTITDYCAAHQVDIPVAVKSFWDQQLALEDSLRSKLDAAPPASSGGASTINTPKSPDGGGGSGVADFFSQYGMYFIIGLILLLLLIAVIVGVSSYKKKKKS